MILVDNLTKRYGKKTAVDGLTFAVEPGMVTGFLGTNGSGKSTTMRLILGLPRSWALYSHSQQGPAISRRRIPMPLPPVCGSPFSPPPS